MQALANQGPPAVAAIAARLEDTAAATHPQASIELLHQHVGYIGLLRALGSIDGPEALAVLNRFVQQPHPDSRVGYYAEQAIQFKELSGGKMTLVPCY